MKISEIYTKYRLPKILQEHQFRVAAVAWQICDSLKEEVDADLLIRACLLHDMGNIVKFDWNHVIDPEIGDNLLYWQELQNEFRAKYGMDDHTATLNILRELSIDDAIIDLAVKTRFELICSHRDNALLLPKIIFYADARVSPFGVVSYEERMEEARKRYEDKIDKIHGAMREKIVACGKDIESQLFDISDIYPQNISNDSIQVYFDRLKNFEF